MKEDKSILEVPLSTVSGGLTKIRINIPVNFPHEKPSLSVTSPVEHPWVNPNYGGVVAPSLQRWGDSGIKLVTVVQEVINELSGKGYGGSPARIPSPSRPRLSSENETPPPALQIAEVPREFPFLDTLSTEALVEALCSPSSYRTLVEKAIKDSKLDSPLQVLRQECIDAAHENRAMDSQLREANNQIAVVKASEYEQARANFELKAQRQGAVLDKLAPEKLMVLLEKSHEESSIEWGSLVDSFLAGSITVEEFVDRGLQISTLVKQRLIKLDRIHSAKNERAVTDQLQDNLCIV